MMNEKTIFMTNEYMSLNTVVFNTLRRKILQGELKPGERLIETKLARSLAVSRSPIREAIRKLELEGLVDTEPRRGAIVSQPTQKNLLDVLEVRRSLEELAVRLACQNMTEWNLKQLHDAEEVFEQVLGEEDITVVAEADVVFHDVIYHMTGNPMLIRLLNQFQEQMYRYRVEYLKRKEFYTQLLVEHRMIVQGIESGVVDHAAEITCTHIDNQVQAVGKLLQASDN